MSRETLPSTAAWWIFRKDAALLWPLAVVFIGLGILLNVLVYRTLPFGASGGGGVDIALAKFAVMLTWVLLVTLLVQQDPLPGSSQDWVVRPVRRADLLFGKLLGLLILIHIPIFLTIATACVTAGFRFARILPPALLGNLYGACLITLPVMAIAALTRTVLEAVLTALAVAVSVAVAFFLYAFILHAFILHGPPETSFAVWHEVIWVWGVVSLFLIVSIGIATLVLSYVWRRVRAAKVLFSCGIFVAIAVLLSPWRLAYAVQQWLSPAAPARAVSLAFAPGAAAALDGRNPEWTELMLRYTPKQSLFLPSSEMMESIILPRTVRIVLPFKVNGVPAGTILHADHVALRITGPEGGVYRGPGWNFDLRVHAPGSSLLGVAINVPKALYDRLAHRPASLRLEFALTLIRPRAFELGIPSEGRLAGLGRCTVREQAGNMGPVPDVACMRVGLEPCVTAQFDPLPGGLIGDEMLHCPLDYEPASLQGTLTLVNHFEIKVTPLVYNAVAGRAYFAVSKAHITLSEYVPVAHFMRTVALQDVDLAAWRYRPKTPIGAVIRPKLAHTSQTQ